MLKQKLGQLSKSTVFLFNLIYFSASRLHFLDQHKTIDLLCLIRAILSKKNSFSERPWMDVCKKETNSFEVNKVLQ
jgi:hypothetical protein